MTAYYNEIDPYAAQWLRNLIEAGHIAPGVVDERSIEDVCPDDLRGSTQCHFFAGVGVWSHALRQAGWPDDRPVWTGSCPCQPFSAAGKGSGFADERHLWPAFHHLIRERRPECVFGEQVASSDSGPWIDLVHDDMEAVGYAFGAVPFPSAGVGAPHIRDRLFWVADSEQHSGGRQAAPADHGQPQADRSTDRAGGRGGASGGLADTSGKRRERGQGAANRGINDGTDAGRIESDDGFIRSSEAGNGSHATGPTNGFWRDADWLFCRDGKWRAVEPGTFPLAHGAPSRVGRLRAYGNAINAEAARAFIGAYLGSSMKAAA